MSTILITGANRGLGLEWVRQYARLDWRVLATCRQPEQAGELHALARAQRNVEIHRLDVTHPDEIATLAEQLRAQPIDLLVNNAGVYFEKFASDRLGEIYYPEWEETLRVNTLGAVRVTEAFAGHVAASQRRLVAAITSHMGSIADIESPGSYAYRTSKAALNAVMRGLSLELRPRGVGVLLLHPGWVKTRMGGPGALIETRESVEGMRRVLDAFTMRITGGFFDYQGREIPW